jgi:hypothetical protein
MPGRSNRIDPIVLIETLVDQRSDRPDCRQHNTRSQARPASSRLAQRR